MKKKIFTSIVIGISAVFLSIGNLENICRIYPHYGFDIQALLLWKYSASIGLLPYKDIFYPYGLLQYYIGVNHFFTVFYLLLTPLIFMTFYYTFQKIFKSALFAIIILLSIYLFVVTLTGFETFTRYGTLTALVALAAYIIYEKKSSKVYLIFGLLTGLLFSLINDIGFYIPAIFIALAITDYFIKEGARVERAKWIRLIQQISIYILGLLVGLLPLLYFLISKSIFLDYILFFSNLRDIAQYAKTPFFNTIETLDNIFILTILLAAIIFVCYKFYQKANRQFTFNTYIQVALIMLLVLLEQKSLIRLIDTQITFVAFILFITLFYDFTVQMQRYKVSKLFIPLYFTTLSFIIIFIVGLKPADVFVNQYPILPKIFTSSIIVDNKACVSNTINHINVRYPEYRKVLDRVKDIPGYNGKIFSFPGEPVFYVLNRQIPPYYPSIYEATPVKAQDRLIADIESQNITIVIYNSKIQSIQDEVPDVVRGRVLYKYIESNFVQYDVVGDYKILKRINIAKEKNAL